MSICAVGAAAHVTGINQGAIMTTHGLVLAPFIHSLNHKVQQEGTNSCLKRIEEKNQAETGRELHISVP